MKKTFTTILASAFLAAGVSSASAVTIDTFLFAADLGNSSAGDEIAALESFLGGGVDLEFDVKYDNGGDPGTLPYTLKYDATAMAWYIEVAPREPGYFILKTGNILGGNQGGYSHFFFENIGEMSILAWAKDLYIDDNGLPTANTAFDEYVMFLGDGGKLSHVTVTKGDTMTPVPLPAAGWLLLAGVGGLAAMRRRKTA